MGSVILCARKEGDQFAEFFEKHYDWTADKKNPHALNIGSQFLFNLLLFRSPTKLKCKQKQCGWRQQQQTKEKRFEVVVVCGNFVSKLIFRWVFIKKKLLVTTLLKVLSKVWPWIIMVRYVLTCLLNGHIQYTLSLHAWRFFNIVRSSRTALFIKSNNTFPLYSNLVPQASPCMTTCCTTKWGPYIQYNI